MGEIIPFPVYKIPFPVYKIPFPLFKTCLRILGSNKYHVPKEVFLILKVEMGEIIPFPV